MVARVQTVAFQGIEAVPVDVQAQITTGLPVTVTIVGLPDKAIKEASDRVRAALLSSGLSLPPKRIVVNLAPADLPKEGSHYDLPIALALMAVIGAFPADALDGYVALGELGLDGRLAPTSGVLPAAMAAHARNLGIICPAPSGPEAAWAGDDVEVVAPESLLALVNHLGGYQLCPRPTPKRYDVQAGLPDLSEVRGQEVARRALEIAAAGGHNLLKSWPLMSFEVNGSFWPKADFRARCDKASSRSHGRTPNSPANRCVTSTTASSPFGGPMAVKR
jgi:magnesium chelatase family protein